MQWYKVVQHFSIVVASFYIIVRGSVSTMVKEEGAEEDEEGGGKEGEDSDTESIPPMETDRTKLGAIINTKGRGIKQEHTPPCILSVTYKYCLWLTITMEPGGVLQLWIS